MKCTRCPNKLNYRSHNGVYGYALYELLISHEYHEASGGKNFYLKIWRTDICLKCWEVIYKNNCKLEKLYPEVKWIEPELKGGR